LEKIKTISGVWRRGFFILPFSFFIVSGETPRQIRKNEKGRMKNVAAACPN
jgi:hypothetical protein